VAGLLPTERPASLLQRSDHVAIADRRGLHLDSRVRHRPVKAVVAHHRHGNPTVKRPGVDQVTRAERQQLVAVANPSLCVDRDHPVAVAVEGEADLSAAPANRIGQELRVGRAAAFVDVPPVRLGGDRLHRGAQSLEDRGRGPVGRPVGAVQHDPAPGEVELERR
jgi:hypothetical protein